MIKAVIFDIDNTLFDFDDASLWGLKAVSDYCRRTFGMEEPQIREYYRRALQLATERVGTDTAAIHNRLIRFQCMMELLDWPVFPHAEALCHAYWDTMIGHMKRSPGIVQLFQALKAKQIHIGIGTDMTAYIQYQKLKVLELSPYVDRIVTSEEAGVEKPHPKFFDLCVEKTGCLAEECAFIGDNLKKDVEGAIAAGLCGIWYTQEKEPGQQMPFPVVRSFENQNEFLKNLSVWSGGI